ncbi:MAG: GNAT family N-acetyltransferase [Nannocystales bacterium]
MTTRTATLEDAAALAELNHHVHDIHVEAEPERYSVTDDAAVAEQFRMFIRGVATEVLLAERGGVAIGYVVVVGVERPAQAFAHARRWALVDQIAVAPHARRTGVGRALMDAAAQSARRRGYPELQLDVRAHNKGARAFYESLGYRVAQSRMQKSV